MSSSSNIRYLGGLDEVRGFAALLVLLYHGSHLIGQKLRGGKALDPTSNPLAALLMEGHTAVGLFFFVSGFVFALGAHGRELRFSEFMRNRILRIYPLLLFMLLLGSTLYRDRIQLLPLLQTLLMLPEYPGALNLGDIGMMFWSIGIEWKCYLLFPLLHRLAARKGIGYLFALVALANLLRIGAALLGSAVVPSNTYYTLGGRFDQFCIGMIFGYQFAVGGLRWARRAILPSAAAVLLMLLAYHRAGSWASQDAWKLVWPTVEALGWGLLVSGYVQLAERRTLPLRPLRWLGIISYSVYLLHYPILSRMIASIERWPIAVGDSAMLAGLANTALLVLPAVVGASVVTYLLIEKPALELRRSYVTERSREPLAAVRAEPQAAE